MSLNKACRFMPRARSSSAPPTRRPPDGNGKPSCRGAWAHPARVASKTQVGSRHRVRPSPHLAGRTCRCSAKPPRLGSSTNSRARRSPRAPGYRNGASREINSMKTQSDDSVKSLVASIRNTQEGQRFRIFALVCVRARPRPSSPTRERAPHAARTESATRRVIATLRSSSNSERRGTASASFVVSRDAPLGPAARREINTPAESWPRTSTPPC